MILDEKLRWFGFWLLDSLKGKQIRTYYNQIQRAWKEGTSIRETEEPDSGTDCPCGEDNRIL